MNSKNIYELKDKDNELFKKKNTVLHFKMDI
jgi:hypothetical protein